MENKQSNELGEEIRAFRTSFRALFKLFLYVFVFGIIVGTFGNLRNIIHGDPADYISAILFVGILVLFMLAIIIIPVVFLYKTRLHTNGLKAYSQMGTLKSVLWKEIKSVQFSYNMIGFSYIDLLSEDENILCTITLNGYSDNKGFRNHVEKYAGHGHVLSKFLNENS